MESHEDHKTKVEDDDDLGMGLESEEDDDDDDAPGTTLWSRGAAKPPQAPEEGMKWQDNAILECFQLALDTHDVSSDDRFWSPPSDQAPPTGQLISQEDQDFLAQWRPSDTDLPLPLWAVDPFRELASRGAQSNLS